MILKCSTGFWTSKFWNNAYGSITGALAANILTKKTNGVHAGHENATSIGIVNLAGGSLFTTCKNSSGVAYGAHVASAYAGVPGQEAYIKLENTIQGVEFVEERQSNYCIQSTGGSLAIFGDTRHIITAFRCYDSGGAMKYYYFGLDYSDGLRLIQSDSSFADSNTVLITPSNLTDGNGVTGTNIAGNPYILRFRIYESGNYVKVKASAFRSGFTYSIKTWTLGGHATNNGLQPWTNSGKNMLLLHPRSDGYNLFGQLSIWEVESSDSAYYDTDVFMPKPICLPLARKSTDIIQRGPDNWTDLTGAGGAGVAWGAITDGNDTTGAIMTTNDKVGIQTNRTLSAIAADNGQSCSAILSVSNMLYRVADDDGEPLFSEIGRVGTSTVQKSFNGIPGTDSLYYHELTASDISAKSITPSSSDIIATWNKT